jgi:hypothetical protein
MSKRNLMNNTKTRRKGSMLQDSLSKIKYLFVLAVLLVLPIQAMAGMPMSDLYILDQTDTGEDRLVAFYDTRSRDTFIQVTNTSSQKVTIHVQLFQAAGTVAQCEELDFYDSLTANDTHVYDVENIVSNDGVDYADIPSGQHGFAVISLETGLPNSLIGMFRIIDESGYEYRTNAAGSRFKDPRDFDDLNTDGIINFSSANGNNLSDLVGITFVSISDDTVYASPGVIATFGSPFDSVLIYNEEENGTSCSSTSFSCAETQIDKAIDNSLPNSLGDNNRICGTSTLAANNAGWLSLPFTGFTCTDGFVGTDTDCDYHPSFVGFIGLNNGDGTGSMDSWWETTDFIVFDKGFIDLAIDP